MFGNDFFLFLLFNSNDFLKVFYSNDLVAYAVLLSSANWRRVADPIMVGQDSRLLNDKDGFIWTFNYLLT
jgi:hypothetical protein